MRAIVFLVWVVMLPAPVSCDKTPMSAPDSDSRTLSTLTKVDDYPLYVMRFYGDYHFDDYLKEGLRSSSLVPDRESEATWRCTTFAALNGAGEYVLGRNFDWNNHMALLLYTDPPQGYASVSMVDISYLGFVPGDPTHENRERLLGAPYYPFDGMNEKGLAVGMMAVSHAEGGTDTSKVTIGSLDAIRLVLDYASNVDEAVVLLGRYNIDFGGGPPVHYLVSDAGRESAVVEFISDRMSVLRSDTLWQVSTNFITTGYPFSGGPSECWRYNLAFRALSEANGLIARGDAMDILRNASQSNTMWSVVYSGANGSIDVVAGRRYDRIHSFTMSELSRM